MGNPDVCVVHDLAQHRELAQRPEHLPWIGRLQQGSRDSPAPGVAATGVDPLHGRLAIVLREAQRLQISLLPGQEIGAWPHASLCKVRTHAAELTFAVEND